MATEIWAWCLYEDRSKQCSFWEQNEQDAKKAKAKEGHIRLKRWYEPGADRDDYDDLTDYGVYYDSVNKQYKVKFVCGDCGKFIGWYCYEINNTRTMLFEMMTGMYCEECYSNENFDIDFEDCEPFDGQLCRC